MAALFNRRETLGTRAQDGIRKGLLALGMDGYGANKWAHKAAAPLLALTQLGDADEFDRNLQDARTATTLWGKVKPALSNASIAALAAVPAGGTARRGAKRIIGGAAEQVARKSERLAMDTASRMARAREMGFDVDIPLYHTRFADYDTIDLGRAGGSHTVGGNERAFFLTDSAPTADSYTGRQFVKTYADGWDKDKLAQLTKQIWAAEDRAKALPPFPIEWRNRPDIPPHAVKAFEDWERGISTAKAEASELSAVWDKATGVAEAYPSGTNIIPAFARGKFLEIDMQGAGYAPEVVERAIKRARKQGKDGVKFLNMYDWGGAPGSASVPQTTYAVVNPEVVRSRFAAFDPAKRNSANIMAGFAGAGVLGGGLFAGAQEPVQPGKVY